MSRLILISGGSGSGKSLFAEKAAMTLAAGKADKGNRLYYIATMPVRDSEDRKRVERHRTLRAGKNFVTLEQRTCIERAALDEGSCALIECLPNLLANEMFDENGAHDNAVESITGGIFSLLRRGCDLVCVTNEIFSDGIVYDMSIEAYIENLGKINAAVAEKADAVCEVVCGIPIFHKGFII